MKQKTHHLGSVAFPPASAAEMRRRNWVQADVVLIHGDGYMDTPFCGIALIARVLERAGFKVVVISQPDIGSGDAILEIGEPRLFWGISGGCTDSMVANFTASGKRRRLDDLTPGGNNDRRPDRAVIAYGNWIRRHFKRTVPIVLGGIESSLRRISHYDFWSGKIRKTILADAKGDYLIYGEGERTVTALAKSLDRGDSPNDLPGICRLQSSAEPEFLRLPDHEEVISNPSRFIEMFRIFHQNLDPVTARGLCQKIDTRFLLHNPPAPYLEGSELDAIHELPFLRIQHPESLAAGTMRAIETVRFSILSHRGCYGECNFCAISAHIGRRVRSRSPESIVREAESWVRHPEFRGIIQDVGGPTANMYAISCDRIATRGGCAERRCLFPEICPSPKPNHGPQLDLLERIAAIPGVRRVFIGSGIRHDLVVADPKNGMRYLKRIIRSHASGQIKIAPEHCEPGVLAHMGKPGIGSLRGFLRMFREAGGGGKEGPFPTYYLLAAHPGCTDRDMESLRNFCVTELRLLPEQVQIFTPTPSTWSTLMYATKINPFTGKPVFVETTGSGRQRQKDVLSSGNPRKSTGSSR